MKYFVIVFFLGISMIMTYIMPDAFGMWAPLSPVDLLEESKTVFVGTVTDITLVDREYQSQIAHDGTIKEEVGPETITLEEYTINIEEFLKNPQNYTTTKVLGAIVGGVPGGPAKISGFEIGDRILFFIPKEQNQTHFPGQYLPESFKIPQQCDAEKVLEQPRIELGNSFNILQNGIAKQDNFTAGMPMKFAYSGDLGNLSGGSIDIEVSIRPYGGNEVTFEKNIHVESEPCTWTASAKWEFTPKEGNYRMYLSIKENERGEATSYTGFSVISENNTLDISPLKQFHSGIPFEEIQCKESRSLIQKYDGSPACVTIQTKIKLVERGWTKYKDGVTTHFSFCGADGFDSKGNLNSDNSTHHWNENECEWIKKDIPKITPLKYSETINDDNPYNNELIIFQKNDSGSLQYDKTKQVIDETFLSKTVGEWQKVSWDVLMEEHEKYLPEHRFFDHLGSFLIKNEFQNVMNELGIVNAEDDFEVKSGMSLDSLPPHNSYYSIIRATDGNYYRLQGGTHANEVHVSNVSALLFFDTSVDFKMEDLVSKNQLFTILPENNKPEIEPSNLVIHTNNSKVEFYNNTPEIIRIQDSGTGRVGEEHLLDWVGPTILPYTTASMTFDEPGNFDFDARFAPNLENPLWWSTHTSGTIIVMSDDMSSVSRDEKNKMAQSLLFDLGLPVIGAGTGNADNVLSVQLDPSVVDVIPNATQYYKERIEQIFPFEVVLDMGY